MVPLCNTVVHINYKNKVFTRLTSVLHTSTHVTSVRWLPPVYYSILKLSADYNQCKDYKIGLNGRGINYCTFNLINHQSYQITLMYDQLST